MSTAQSWKPASNPWLVAITVTLAVFMEILDVSIVDVARPHIVGSLSSSYDEYQHSGRLTDRAGALTAAGRSTVGARQLEQPFLQLWPIAFDPDFPGRTTGREREVSAGAAGQRRAGLSSGGAVGVPLHLSRLSALNQRLSAFKWG